MTARLAAAAVLVLAAAVGCGAAPDPHLPAAVAATAAVAPTTPAPAEHLPTTIDVPKLKLHTDLAQTGLNADHTLQVPPLTDPMEVSWYRGSSPPGDAGAIPAIVLAHVNAYGKAGAFQNLAQMAPGDTITVGRDGAPSATFVVYRNQTVPKCQAPASGGKPDPAHCVSAFPTQLVYGYTAAPELRLITCGGALNPAAHSYIDNVVVFARLLA